METTGIQIRRATISDLSSICDLSQQLFEYERQFTNEYNMDWSHAKEGQKFFSKCLRSRKSFTLLAQDGDKLVGYILVTIHKLAWRAFNPIAEVDNLSISPEYRGKGIGTKLLLKAKQLAIKRGAKRMSVSALSDNVRALHFYHQYGFEKFVTSLVMKMN